jgi:hypothetical protein
MGADRQETLKPDFEALFASLREIERLLQFPSEPDHVERANALAVAIAKQAGSATVADLVMKLIGQSAKLRAAAVERKDLNHTLWHLRIALQEAKTSKGATKTRP